jgi:biotin carboxylase
VKHIRGAADIEFKMKNGRPIIIEINPRPAGFNMTQIIDEISGK